MRNVEQSACSAGVRRCNDAAFAKLRGAAMCTIHWKHRRRRGGVMRRK